MNKTDEANVPEIPIIAGEQDGHYAQFDSIDPVKDALGTAWNAQDPAKLVEASGMFKEALKKDDFKIEALSVENVLHMALKLAVYKQDMKTVDAIEKIAEEDHNKSLEEENDIVEVLDKLGDDSRQLLESVGESHALALKWGLDDIFIRADKNKGWAQQSAGKGFTLIDVDLNKGCGAKTHYIYAQVAYRQTSNPIVDLYVIEGNDASALPGWTKINVDLNKGAGGAFLYLVYRRSSTENPITALHVLRGKDAPAPPGWIKINVDLNKGAGGEYLYFTYKK